MRAIKNCVVVVNITNHKVKITHIPKQTVIESCQSKCPYKNKATALSTLRKILLDAEKFIPKLKFLTNEKVKNNLEDNLKYIQEHCTDYDSDICDNLGLVNILSE